MSGEVQPTRSVDEDKANAPPRAVDVYLIASRLKRMIVASTAANMASIAGDQADMAKQLREFHELSRGIEPLLESLVYEDRRVDE